MVKAKIKIKNPTGLHLRPAGIFRNEAGKYDCSIMFNFRNSTSNAKSVLASWAPVSSAGTRLNLL